MFQTHCSNIPVLLFTHLLTANEACTNVLLKVNSGISQLTPFHFLRASVLAVSTLFVHHQLQLYCVISISVPKISFGLNYTFLLTTFPFLYSTATLLERVFSTCTVPFLYNLQSQVFASAPIQCSH